MNRSDNGISAEATCALVLSALVVGSAVLSAGVAAGHVADGTVTGSAEEPETDHAADTVRQDDRPPGTEDSLRADAGRDPRPPADASPPGDNDTTVMWRGFKHAWSYNHRFNRIGSEVRPSPASCDPQYDAECVYDVEHSGASGSGQDDAMFRDAYTELSARGVDFYTGSESIELDGHEDVDQDADLPPTVKNEVTRRSDLADDNQTLHGTEDVTIQFDDDATYGDGVESAVLLNGFDLYSNPNSRAAKVKTFDLDVRKKSVTNDELTLSIEYEVLFDCDSPECKGVFKKDGVERGGNHVQKVDYTLVVSYLAAVGSDETLNIVRPETEIGNDGRIENEYGWAACKNNKFGSDSKHDKWNKDKGKFPNNRMYCEATGEEELDSEDFWIEGTINGLPGYSVGTVGIQSLDFELDKEAHFTQYDNVVGGSYDPATGEYDLRALPFLKEWSARPGEYEDAWGAMGHAGHAEVGTTPVLLQIKDGCKRSFVSAGGDTWATGPGKELDASSRDAVTRASHEFEFGEQWTGHYGNGNMCGYDGSTSVDPPSDMAMQDWDGRDQGFWAEQDAVDEDPTSIRSMPSDRYYGSPSSSPTYFDLDDVSADAVAASGDRGNVPLIRTKYASFHAGTFVGEAAIDVYEARTASGRVDIRRYLHADATGKIRRPGSSGSRSTDFSVKKPGRYAVVVVANRMTRVGNGPPSTEPSVAVVEFRVVDDPTRPRKTVDYRFEGGDGKVVSYQWNGRAKRWERENSDTSNGRVFQGQKPKHRFKGSVTPTVKVEHRNVPEDAYHDVNLRVDGKNVGSGAKVTDPGNHTFELYVCHNVVGANCNEGSLYREQKTESNGRRQYTKDGEDAAGKRLSGGVALVANHTLEVETGPANLSNVNQGTERPDLSTGTAGPGEKYAGALEGVDVGSNVPFLVKNERITVRVRGTDGVDLYSVRVKDGRVQEVRSGKATDPTMKVTTDEKTMSEVTRSDDRQRAISRNYEDGEISVEGVGMVNSVKVGAAKAAKGLYDAVTGVLS